MHFFRYCAILSFLLPSIHAHCLPRLAFPQETVTAIAISNHFSTCGPPPNIILGNIVYALRLSGQHYEGTAQALLLFGAEKPITLEFPITASLETIRAFLDILAKSDLTTGPYVPAVKRPAELWFTEIVVVTKEKSYTFFSSSQADDLAPWSLSVSGQRYVVLSGRPNVALGVLDACLEKRRLMAIIESRHDSH
jgi:hypothetical protein